MNLRPEKKIGQRAMEELLRKFPNSTITELADRIGCDRQLPYNWEKGTLPSTGYIVRFLEIGLDVGYILTGRRTE